ncbi:hypothetical protein [Marinomonas ostreistagni]|uniref:hypothetical protein n=1 Tax=Marinomonas ostreistagni TaxID=359209 RepID=UPI001950D0EC|nr:hypothetical protein [Marinomonas ostreistagni]MBM6550856.1 hypothetical protein [Marinomonas ostreistagni]
MKDIKKVFRNLEQALKKTSWFDDGWEIYNRGPYIQLYKDTWYNHNQGGVHFETYIEEPQIKKKAFPVCLHAEEDCPNRERFMAEFLALEGERINSWKDYQVIGEGHNVCQRSLPLNFKNLEQRLLEELNRLRQLEDSIDQALANAA